MRNLHSRLCAGRGGERGGGAALDGITVQREEEDRKEKKRGRKDL
jgi:hypothetical protein